jgi:hypothetical protein
MLEFAGWSLQETDEGLGLERTRSVPGPQYANLDLSDVATVTIPALTLGDEVEIEPEAGSLLQVTAPRGAVHATRPASSPPANPDAGGTETRQVTLDGAESVLVEVVRPGVRETMLRELVGVTPLTLVSSAVMAVFNFAALVRGKLLDGLAGWIASRIRRPDASGEKGERKKKKQKKRSQ